MSIRLFAASFGTFLFVLIFSVVGRDPAATRSIATVDKAPQTAPQTGAKILGKHDRMLEVSVEATDQLPTIGDDIEVRVIARVTLRRAISGDLHFKWVLPEGVHVVAGQTQDSWHNVLPDQEVTTELSLTGVSKEELKTILFDAYTIVNDVRIGASAAFSTQPENFIAPSQSDATEGLSALKDAHL